jgi:hypothetical protein
VRFEFNSWQSSAPNRIKLPEFDPALSLEGERARVRVTMIETAAAFS